MKEIEEIKECPAVITFSLLKGISLTQITFFLNKTYLQKEPTG